MSAASVTDEQKCSTAAQYSTVQYSTGKHAGTKEVTFRCCNLIWQAISLSPWLVLSGREDILGRAWPLVSVGLDDLHKPSTGVITPVPSGLVAYLAATCVQRGVLEAVRAHRLAQGRSNGIAGAASLQCLAGLQSVTLRGRVLG